MAITTELKAALAQRHIGRIALLVELNLDSGALYFTTNSSPIVFDGKTFNYLGDIGSVSNVKETSKLDPADYELVIGGIDKALISLFIDQPIINRTCSVHWVLLDENGAVIPDPVLLFRGLLQPPELNFGESSVIRIPVRDILADWDRDIRTLYTHEQQIRDYPGDFCFADISSSADLNIVWPASSYWD